MNPFHRIANRLAAARQARAAKREATRFRSALAALPADLGVDKVVDFLFSAEAEAIVPWQIKEEFRALARLVAERRPRAVLEIGTADGGTLFAHARLAAPDALVLSVDLPEGPFGGGYPAWRTPLYEAFARPGQRLELLRADSHAPATAERIEELLGGRRVEYAFIDGDHTYDGVRRDFELCRRFAADDAVVAFHDIVAQPNTAYLAEAGSDAHAPWAVHDFWREVKQRYRHEEFVQSRGQEGYGIGVLYLGEPTQDAP
jgi:cephalosporin hydroxylase